MTNHLQVYPDEHVNRLRLIQCLLAFSSEMLVNYIERGEDPFDDFIYAILSNDLKGAVHTADDLNLPMIHHIVAWLYNYAPAACQGSNVNKWIDRKGLSNE